MNNYHKYGKQLFNSRYSSRIEIFFKGWYLLLILKVLLLGSLFDDLYRVAELNNQIFFPFGVIQDPIFVKIILIPVLICGLYFRRNYLLSLLIFFLYIPYYRIVHPIVNGSDLVLSSFLFLGIFCNNSPAAKSELTRSLQTLKIAGCILIGQVQIAFMYLTSGWDKLISIEWRNGDAMYNLLHVDFYAVPWLRETLGNSDAAMLVTVSWMVILFELLFPVLIWFNKTKALILIPGVLFHLFIGLFLSLPDFALTMMWCYILFMKDETLAKWISLGSSRKLFRLDVWKLTI